MRFLALLVLLAFSLPMPGQEPKYAMTTYYVAFLKSNPEAPKIDAAEMKKIMAGHMANIRASAEAGKLLLAGPFTDKTALRGMFVLTVGSMDEAKALCEADPAVKAGALVFEIHPWFGPKNVKVDP